MKWLVHISDNALLSWFGLKYTASKIKGTTWHQAIIYDPNLVSFTPSPLELTFVFPPSSAYTGSPLSLPRRSHRARSTALIAWLQGKIRTDVVKILIVTLYTWQVPCVHSEDSCGTSDPKSFPNHGDPGMAINF